MAIEVFNRYEVKYLLDYNQYKCIMDTVPKYMNCDPYNKENQFYSISNLYLDTDTDYFINKSLDKPIYKSKIRLRGYGVPSLSDTVYLEIKKKFNGLVNKRRTPFILKEAYDFIEFNKIPVNSKLNKQVFNEINYLMDLSKAYIKVYISYDRFAFFEKNNNDFRMTIDKNIQTRRTNLQLEDGIYGTQLLPPDTFLMEAKSASTFPLWFSKLLANNKIYSNSFSKYGEEYKKFIFEGKKNYA